MWEPLAPAAEGGGEEKKELTKLECLLVPSFFLLPAWCAYLCVYFLFNCPMLVTLFKSIHALESIPWS